MAGLQMKRRDLSIQEKKNILDSYDKLPKMSQRNAAVQLKISQPLLCKLLKNRTNIDSASISNNNMDRKREHQGKDHQVESALKIWFGNVREKNAPVNGPILRQKAEELAKVMGKDNFSATNGWFNRWKKHENIVYKQLQGEEKSADYAAANDWLRLEWPKIISEYSPRGIYNADETGLYFRAMPEHTYLFKNETAKGFKCSKERVTVLCCVNMIGEKRKLLVIGKSTNPRCFKNVKSLPVDYFSTSNAWMTSVIFQGWLTKWDRELKRKIILLIDNCTAHTNNLALKNIKIIFLPSNTTALIQPCDQGIIRTLKAYYRKQMRMHIIDSIDSCTQLNACAIAKKISLLNALYMLAMSWNQVSETTIENCFKKGGFSQINCASTSPSEEPVIEENNIHDPVFDIPDGMSENEFQDWINIDNNLEVVATMSDSEICELVVDNSENENTTAIPSVEDEIFETPPSDAQMREALRILRCGVQHRETNFQKFFEFEKYIEQILNVNKCQTTLNKYLF